VADPGIGCSGMIPPLSLLSSMPFLSLKSARGSGERCKLPTRAREPGGQTLFMHFESKIASGCKTVCQTQLIM